MSLQRECPNCKATLCQGDLLLITPQKTTCNHCHFDWLKWELHKQNIPDLTIFAPLEPQG